MQTPPCFTTTASCLLHGTLLEPVALLALKLRSLASFQFFDGHLEEPD